MDISRGWLLLMASELFLGFNDASIAYWTEKQTEEVTMSDTAGVYLMAAAWPLLLFTGCGEQKTQAEIQAELALDKQLKELDKKNPDNRQVAAGALAELAESDISVEVKSKMLDPLIKCLEDDSSNVREKATMALRKLANTDISHEQKGKMVDPIIKS